MKIEDFDIKVPWWAKMQGWWNRGSRLRAERRAPRPPVYQGSLIGRTIYSQGGAPHNTHRWDLYETRDGHRTAKFISMQGPALSKDGSDHVVHASVVTPWLHKRYEVDWKKTRESGGPIYGHRR